MQRNAQPLGSIRQSADSVEQASTGPWLAALTRLGYAAKGITYIVVGWLALLAVLGMGGTMTDQRGAVRSLSETPYGGILLGALTVGLAGYAAWYLARAVFDLDHKGREAKGLFNRSVYGGVGISYLLLAFGALQLVLRTGDGGQSSDAMTRDWTTNLLAQSWGGALVVAAGIVVLGVAGFQFYQAYSKKFAEHLKQYEMSETTRELVIRLGQIGWSARGIVFGVIGLFLVIAGITANPEETRGLGGALATLAQQPYGSLLAGVVAIGLTIYGLYSLAQARYLSLNQIRHT